MNIPLDKFTVNIEAITRMIDAMYEQHNCLVGGPLHVIVDDGNVKDSDLVFCYREVHARAGLTPFERMLCLGILHELMMLNETQRIMVEARWGDELKYSIEDIWRAGDK